MAQDDSPTASAKKSFPIVGIGASAGGLEAFIALLEKLPPDTGMGFVVVQHLAPTQTGMLPVLLAKTTAMPVLEVTQGMVVERNHVYVIPPNTQMVIGKGVLKLLPRPLSQGQARAIDIFFQALAADSRHEAIGVILSGTASDGTLGLEAIKAEGGITFAQDETAKFDSMPRSAIAAGCVDFVMPPTEIAAELTRLASHPYVAAPPEATPEDAEPVEPGDDFKKLFALLRRSTGTDFSTYKSATLKRRLHRRMVLGKFKDLPAYVSHLAGNAAELEALGGDFLIGVTNFFRDPEAFSYLKRKVFPRLLKAHRGQPAEETVRVWVLGCSTGQEAYSIAMSWLEFADTARTSLALQIFSTDIHPPYLDRARAGVYTRSLLQDVSPERLRRFFVEVDGGFRVNKMIRDMCVFARQNVLTDPPFSQLDLISCRNMLIYVRAELQKKVIPTFHFALKPGGVLFLGSAETVSGFSDLFAPLDSKIKFFLRKPAPIHARVRFDPASPALQNTAREPLRPSAAPPALSTGLKVQREADRLMLERHAPVGVIINAELEVLQFRGSTGPYLEPASGKASLNLLEMAREGLFAALRTATKKAVATNRPAKISGIVVKQDDRSLSVDVEVLPLRQPASEQRCFLVNFHPALTGAHISRGREMPPRPRARSKSEARADSSALQRELAETKVFLQSVIEQQNAYNEELQSANEEAQASNEELQSINEEMETAKEELQASNEELTTLNEELHTRNDQLAITTSDVTNLMVSVNLPVVMLDRNVRVRRFTPQAEKFFRLLATDVGRPLADLTSSTSFPELAPAIARVIDTVTPHEQEVQDSEGRWYVLRLRPYLTTDNKVDGAVMMLIDINELKRTQALITAARDYTTNIVETIGSAILILDSSFKVLSANRAFYELFRVSPVETANTSIYELGNGQWNVPELHSLLQQVVPQRRTIREFEIEKDFPRIGEKILRLNVRPMLQPGSERELILVAIEDITESRRAQRTVRLSEVRYRRLFEAARDGVLIMDPVTRKIIDANSYMTELLGHSHRELVGRELYEIGLLKDEDASRAAFRELQNKGFLRYDDLPLKSKNGLRREVEIVANLYREGGYDVIQCNIRDVTERKRTEQALRASEHRFRALFELGPVAVYTCDAGGFIQEYNRRAVELWGREPLLGDDRARFCGSFKLFRPDNTFLPHDDCPMAEVLSGKIAGADDQEVVIERTDGSRLTVIVNIRPLRDEQGKIMGAINCFYDITERKRSEEALRESAQRLRFLAESMPQKIFTARPDGEVDYFNRPWLEFTGLTFDQISGWSWKQFIHPEDLDETIRLWRAAVDSGEPYQQEHRFRRRDGVYRWHLSRAHAMRDADSRIVMWIGTNTDIDEQMRVEKKLEETVADRTAELKDIIGELEAFSYTLAHDLRGPLRTMQGYANILKDDYSDSLDDMGRRYINKISTATQRMHALVTDVLTFTRFTREALPMESVALGPVLATIIEQYPTLKVVDIQIAGELPAVLANPAALSQAISNLLTNAVKFMPPGRVPNIEIRAEEDEAWVTLFVEDNGIGIDSADHERIFKTFERAVPPEQYEGTGIGLAIVRRTVERMGGIVGVVSALSKGSTFWMKLRRSRSD